MFIWYVGFAEGAHDGFQKDSGKIRQPNILEQRNRSSITRVLKFRVSLVFVVGLGTLL